MTRKPLMERAFELARSGKFKMPSNVADQLAREGYEDARDHLSGTMTRRQIAEAIRMAVSTNAA